MVQYCFLSIRHVSLNKQLVLFCHVLLFNKKECVLYAQTCLCVGTLVCLWVCVRERMVVRACVGGPSTFVRVCMHESLSFSCGFTPKSVF